MHCGYNYSMDIFFQDPTAIPLPPGEVRITDLRAQPLADGRRVKVILELTPFIKRPNGEMRITNSQHQELASISIIETMTHKMEFTLHLRGAELNPPYSLAVEIFYLEVPVGVDPPDEISPDLQTKKVVDHRSITIGSSSPPPS